MLFLVGIGTNLHFINRKNLDWGYAQWIDKLIDIMMDGADEANIERMDEISSNYDFKKTMTWVKQTWR